MMTNPNKDSLHAPKPDANPTYIMNLQLFKHIETWRNQVNRVRIFQSMEIQT